MLIYHANIVHVEDAAARVGVRLDFGNPKGRALRVRLKTKGTGDALKYGRRGRCRRKDGERRRVPGAVCWHGHRDFFRALYDLAGPNVRVKTMLADYRNADHFELEYPTTTPTPCDCAEVSR